VVHVLPRTRTRFGERGFLYSGQAAWNTLPSDLHDITDTSTFIKQLESVLFDHAYNRLLLALLDRSHSGTLQILCWLIDWLYILLQRSDHMLALNFCCSLAFFLHITTGQQTTRRQGVLSYSAHLMPCSMKKFTQQMNRCKTSLQVPSGRSSVSKDNVREMFFGCFAPICVHIVEERWHFTKHMWTGMLCSECNWTGKLIIVTEVR